MMTKTHMLRVVGRKTERVPSCHQGGATSALDSGTMGLLFSEINLFLFKSLLMGFSVACT